MDAMRFNRDATDLPKPGLLICDVDRTLLTHDHELLPRVIEAARILKEAGIPLVLASARSPAGLAHVHRHVDAADAAICFNGAWAGSLSTLDMLVEERIPHGLAAEVMEVAHKQGGSPIWFMLDRCFAFRTDRTLAQHQADITGDTLSFIDDTSEAPGEPYKLMVTMPAETIAAMVASMAERYRGQLEVTQSGPTLAEIVTLQSGKHLAAQRLIEWLDVDARSVAAAGDSDNDAELLRWAAVAITVDNAKPHIKQIADIVTASCDEGGIAMAFKWMAAY